MNEAVYLAVAAVLLLLGLLASKISTRFGIPALLLFLGVGMLAGSEGLGGIEFDDFELARSVSVVALAFILYASGLDTQWSEVRSLLGPGLSLATLGTLITAGIVGVAAAWIFGLPILPALLVGAIVSSTDAAAVFSILRSSSVGLKGQLRPLLELESGSNDPMAIFLTISLLDLITEPATGAVDILLLFVTQMTVGAVVGFVAGRGSVFAINRIHLGFEGLYPVGLIATVLLAYSATDLLGGSGFLAVYVAGLAMGRSPFIHKKSLMRFADGLAWLMQIALFLVLGLLVFPSQLLPVAGGALAALRVPAVRRASPAVAPLLAPARFNWRETVFVSWVGLRGAVPIVLATFPLVRGIPEASLIFNVVFFIVLASVLFQGTTIPWVARRLRVDAPAGRRDPYPARILEAGEEGVDLQEIVVPAGSPAAGHQIVDLGLPEEALVVLVTRAEGFLIPQGSTVILAGDKVRILGNAQALQQARLVLTGGR